MDILEQIKKTKHASYSLANLADSKRTTVLYSLLEQLRQSYNKILAANAMDLAVMDNNNPMYNRLLLTEVRLNTIVQEIEQVIALKSPIGTTFAYHTNQAHGLHIYKVAVPLGTVAMIYESRPNVTIDAFTLCFKTGNACILKGGKEAYQTNLILVQLMHQALLENDIATDAVYLFPPGRDNTAILLNTVGLIDVCIPRGGKSLIDFVRTNTRIPVIETGAGVVHTYFDLSGDVHKGRDIITNAKTRKVSACNALDCLLIHKSRIHDLYTLIEPLRQHRVEIFADQDAYATLVNLYPQQLVHPATQEDFGHEFIAYKLAIKTVTSVEQAIEHITLYSSKHSEAIITEDEQIAAHFLKQIDAAVVYVNTSTAFTDGGQFGMGSELGISTQKLHARGPMGLEALTSYKWIVRGHGQIRS